MVAPKCYETHGQILFSPQTNLFLNYFYPELNYLGFHFIF